LFKTLEVLFRVPPRERHRQRTKPTSLIIRRSRRERWRETLRTTTMVDFKAAGGFHVRGFGRRPWPQVGFGRVRPASIGGLQRGASATEEIQFEVFEGQLRVLLERRPEAARDGVRFDMAR